MSLDKTVNAQLIALKQRKAWVALVAFTQQQLASIQRPSAATVWALRTHEALAMYHLGDYTQADKAYKALVEQAPK